MILDRIENAARSYPMHPGFRQAFEYLGSLDLAAIEDGRYEVDGDRIFMIVTHRRGKGRDGTKLECHHRYIDIQCTVGGTDLIGWKHLAECAGEGLGYDEAKDVEFFPGKAGIWVPTPPGTFAVFFPEDVHAPLGAEEELFKVIIKIAVGA